MHTQPKEKTMYIPALVIKLTGNVCTPLHVCRLCCHPIIISDLDVLMDWRQRHGEEWYYNNQYKKAQALFSGRCIVHQLFSLCL